MICLMRFCENLTLEGSSTALESVEFVVSLGDMFSPYPRISFKRL